ncbi:hypothetical protein [Micrococcus sp.]|uniref:hypothetical protein n=1 Tax=Micrococcus sp. TaxID=1271 RepID=UPI002A90D0C2|nr:hypothetical protein [Micrococcus sp.]MDY6055354.1 hypothetical protein [Micrococcus sp.]
MTTPSRMISRRTVATGLAWAAPAAAAVAAAPAYAASQSQLTASDVRVNMWVYRYYRLPPEGCATGGGFIDLQGCTSASGPANATSTVSDCLRDPNASTGYWLETSNSTSGVARVDSITATYTFSNPIVIDPCPNGTYNQDTTATWQWTECTTLNGWTLTLSPDGKTLTLQYSIPTLVNTSTDLPGSGDYLPGYFINYHTADPCIARLTTVSTRHSMTYATATDPNGVVYTRSTSARRLI